MKHSITLLLLHLCLTASAQFAIVHDKDSTVNVREDANPNSTIIDKLHNGDLIYCFEDKGNWTNIDYAKKGKEQNGYIYKDRHTAIATFTPLKKIREKSNSITLQKDSITVTLTQSKFEKRLHKFTYLKDYPTQIKLIDNKPYWGKDGGMPTSQFNTITISIGQRMYTLPKIALQGLYEPSLFSAEANYDKDNDILYIQTSNSDGAGSYEVIWKIEKGVYKSRLVAYGF